MKKGEGSFLAENEISQIQHLINVLGKQIEQFEVAYNSRNPVQFNSIKKKIIQIQRKIQSLIK